VKRLLPGSQRQSRAERNDAETAAQLLAAAKSFFGGIMHTKGRRTETDMNAFWAAISALIPQDLLEKRGGRAATRILGTHYRVVKQGAEVRAELEEHGKSFSLTQAELHAGQQFEAGWKVVRGHWFSLKCTEAQSGARIYTALSEETLFNVQSMMRLKDVRFTQAVPRRTRTSTSDWFKNNTFKLTAEVYQMLLNSL